MKLLVARVRITTPRLLETLNARSGMRPLVPGLSKLRLWTASRLPMSQPRSQLPWKSFTGFSATLIDVSDAAKESGKAHQLAPRFRILITTTRMLFRHDRGLGRRDPDGPAVLGFVTCATTTSRFIKTSELTDFKSAPRHIFQGFETRSAHNYAAGRAHVPPDHD